MMLLGRREDIVTTGITTAVVMVVRSNESPRCVATTVAAGSRHRGWNRSRYRM